MQSLVNQYSKRAPYRLASAVLLTATLGLPIGVVRLGGPEWLGISAGLAVYILLVVVTYHRLRDAALSSGWIALMILVFNAGPSWEGLAPMTLHVGHLIHLIPVFLAWTIPANAGGNPKVVEAH